LGWRPLIKLPNSINDSLAMRRTQAEADREDTSRTGVSTFDGKRAFLDALHVQVVVSLEKVQSPGCCKSAPCGYISFADNTAYEKAVSESKARRWPTVEMPGGHFYLLVDPPAVADALVNLMGRLQA
jgi:hypothetical protein